MNKKKLLISIDQWIEKEFFNLESMNRYSRGKLEGMNFIRNKIKEES